MKKKKFSSIVLIIFLAFVVFNTILSYVSYKKVCAGKEPVIILKKTKDKEMVVYNQLLYKIIAKESENIRTVSLKLFFLN